ncbi:MAG TPA: hypothetical protein VEL02_08195 [Jatrophihabitantaceae bacterium]|nr:hypothetical protein [Jatrophihabitantaceae bacterium]
MPLGGRATIRHPIWLGLVAATVAVAGCASVDHAAPPAPGVAAVASPAITASRDGHTVAYALAATKWTTVALPHRPADGQSVAAHGHDIYAAIHGANGITLEASHDGGQSWQRRPVAGTSDPGTVDVALSPDGTRLAIVLDHPGAAGAVGQAAVLLGEAKGGAFTSHDAPAGGRVTWWNGRLALSGGALSSRLYVSDPKAAAWTPVAVGGPVAPLRNVEPGAASIGAPIRQPDGSLLVPVTNHAGSPSVALFATTDGSTFRKVAAIALSGELGAGTSAPVAELPDGTVFVADPNTARLHVVRGSAQSSFVPRGLPAPPSTMTFATATMGIAQVDTANCASGKTGCTIRSEVYATTDSGKSWERS